MKILLTLVAIVSLLVSCDKTTMPKFPDSVVKHYALSIKGTALPQTLISAIVNPEEVRQQYDVACLEFDIVSKHPYKIKFNAVVELPVCSGVGGYKAEDMVQVLNWVDDVWAWAETKKQCFK